MFRKWGSFSGQQQQFCPNGDLFSLFGGDVKIERLLAIIVLLLNQRKTTAKQLAERFEVSVRTIYRDITTLNGAGIPVLACPGHEGGLSIPEGYRLSRQLLGTSDLEAMDATLRGVNRAMASKDLQRIIDKFDNLLLGGEEGLRAPGSPSLVVDITPWGPTSTSEETVRTVQRAVDNGLVIDFSYTDIAGRQSRRQVEPHTLVFKGYCWYVIGFCRLRDDFRLFRLSRISKPTLAGEHFLRREVGDVRRFFDFECGPMMAVKLRFSARARAKVEDLFPDIELTMDHQGFLTGSLELPDDPWLFSLLLGFGTDLEILSPLIWRERMAQIAGDLKNLYPT